MIAPLDARCSLMHDKEKFLFFTEKPKDWGRGCAAIVNLTTPAYLATLKRSRFSDARSGTLMCGRVRSGTLWNALLQSKFNSLQAPQQPSRPKEPQQPQGWMLSFDFCLPIPQLSEKNRIFREEPAFLHAFLYNAWHEQCGYGFYYDSMGR